MFRQPSIYWALLSVAVFTSHVNAGFEEATEAYLQGNFEKARYEALVSAMDGRPEAQMLMGQLYMNGEGVEKDIALAVYWYEKAAEQDFNKAQFLVGSLYYEGKRIEKNYKKAWRWLNEAKKKGHPKTQDMLDNLLQLESGDVVNINESLTILEEASNRGEKNAQLLYAKKLMAGVDFEQDKNRAVQMVTEIAKGGYIKAQKYLGEMYAVGEGVAQDYLEAYAWSMAYSGTNKIGGLIREGKQTARSSLRKLDHTQHQAAYLKSKEYFEQYVLPVHPNARPVGPNQYRIVVRRLSASKKSTGGINLGNTPKKPAAKSTSTANKATKDPAGSAASNSVGTPKNPAKKATEQTHQSAVTKEKPGIKTAAVPSFAAQAVKKTPLTTKKPAEPSSKIKPRLSNRRADDVNLVLEKSKGQIDTYFNQAQDEDPTLQGRIDFEIRIEASGDVSDVKLLSSDIDSPVLEQQLVDHLKGLSFGVQQVKPYTFTYPLRLQPR